MCPMSQSPLLIQGALPPEHSDLTSPHTSHFEMGRVCACRLGPFYLFAEGGAASLQGGPPPLVFGRARNWGAWQPNMSPYDNVIVFVDNDIVFVNTNIIFADHNIVFADKQAIFANNGLVFATNDIVFSDTNVNSLRKKMI